MFTYLMNEKVSTARYIAPIRLRREIKILSGDRNFFVSFFKTFPPRV